MNKLERVIYNLLKTNPRLKNQIRNIYQQLMSLVPVSKIISDYHIVTRNGYFFGFHDKTPFSPDDKLLLAHKYIGVDNKTPQPDDWVEIGYFSGDDYLDFKTLSKTSAWNWTQGSMLQWVGKTNDVIFNDFNGESHIAKILDNEGKFVDELPAPVGAVSSDGNKALSYSFARLRKGMPGYGYANGIDFDDEINIPDRAGSGLKVIDLASKDIVELFTVSDIAKLQPEPSMKDAFHYFTHCLFAPSNERFVFFHRWLVDDNKRYTRMISSDLSGNELYIFPTSEMVSHIAWKDDENILAYARTKRYDDKYYLFKDKKGEFKVIGEHCFRSDGHPQFSPDGKFILTDTYPDRFRRQHLIIYDFQKGERKDIAKLQLPLKYLKGPRCDFHPRWNRKGDMVCFDSAHTGRRALCTINLREQTS